MPPSEATSQYPSPSAVSAIPTIGLLRCREPVEPWNLCRAVGEDPAVGRHEVVAVAGRHHGHADDGLVEHRAAERPQERGAGPVGEDPTVGGHEAVARAGDRGPGGQGVVVRAVIGVPDRDTGPIGQAVDAGEGVQGRRDGSVGRRRRWSRTDRSRSDPGCRSRSRREFRNVWPTAVHDVALKQLTPSSAPPKPVDGFGAGLMVKAEPVQSATMLSLEAVMEPPKLSPTAAQKLTPAHETELNSLDGPGRVVRARHDRPRRPVPHLGQGLGLTLLVPDRHAEDGAPARHPGEGRPARGGEIRGRHHGPGRAVPLLDQRAEDRGRRSGRRRRHRTWRSCTRPRSTTRRSTPPG